ncbi:MAG: PKD domain-containing protein [Prolixibacteraceae bacterium]|nr:PKD domain-containing protein [Prolixibacteraceae bacterium]
MKKLIYYLLFSQIAGIMLLFYSCNEETDRPVFPLSAEIFHSVKDKQVAFTALTHSAVAWSWDFGDGQTSTEQNPVHIYNEGGYYVATLTATDTEGNSVTNEVNLAIALTPYALLTGDHTQPDYDGKTWKLTADHSSGGDYFANSDASFSVVDGTPSPLPTGIFDLEFGMGDIYKDEFTFYNDGSYTHDVKNDGAAFGGIVYQFVLNGGADIINANGQDYGLCIARYTPETGATFTYTEEEDFTVASVYGGDGTVTYQNVSTLDFSGTEFIGFRDFQQKVILKEITDERMQLVMFMAAAPDYLPMNTHALVLSFEVVK